jgi:hypothetical protein
MDRRRDQSTADMDRRRDQSTADMDRRRDQSTADMDRRRDQSTADMDRSKISPYPGGPRAASGRPKPTVSDRTQRGKDSVLGALGPLDGEGFDELGADRS